MWMSLRNRLFESSRSKKAKQKSHLIDQEIEKDRQHRNRELKVVMFGILLLIQLKYKI